MNSLPLSSQANDIASPTYDGIPPVLLSSFDWQTRCLYRPGLVRVNRPAFCNVVRERLAQMNLRERIPGYLATDTPFYWRARDAGYCNKVFALVHAEDAPFKSAISWFDSRAIALTTSPFRDVGVPFFGPYSNDSADSFMPYEQLKSERRTRHLTEAFVPSYMQEYRAYRPNAVGSAYPVVPQWYAAFEGPFSFSYETSPMVTYFGRRLMTEPNCPEWVILLNEQLIFQAASLVYEARLGRLF